MHGSTKTSSRIRLLGVFALVLGIVSPVFAQGGPPMGPIGEILAQIAILNDKIEALQEDLDTLDTAGGEHPTLRWDQQLPAADRFEVLAEFNDEAVLDKETGLVWEQAPQTTTHNWADARFQCTGRTTGGRKGWRLPSVPELASLVDPANTNLALPAGHPFTDVQSNNYWSAATDADSPTDAWSVGFNFGNVGIADKTLTLRVWCVRGGMNADQY